MSVQINQTQTTYNNSCIDKEKIMTHIEIVIIIILIGDKMKPLQEKKCFYLVLFQGEFKDTLLCVHLFIYFLK